MGEGDLKSHLPPKGNMNVLIVSAIFLVPLASIIPMNGTVIWYPQLLMLMVIGFMCLSMLVWSMNRFISIFLMYLIFSYLIVCGQSPRAMLCMITGYGGIMFSYVVSRSSLRNVYIALAVMVVINFIFVILQTMKLDPIFKPNTSMMIDRVVGFMGSRNQLSIFHSGSSLILTVLSPIFLLTSLPILIVKCSSAFMGTMAGVSSYLFFNGKRLLAILIVLIMIISVPILMLIKTELKGEIKERLNIWKLTIEQTISGKVVEDNVSNPISSLHRIVNTNPLFGFGLGNFFVFSPMSQGIVWEKGTHEAKFEHAHNDLIESFFEFGYIGLVLVMLCISSVVSDFLCCINKTKGLVSSFSALVALFICSMGVYVAHAPVSLFLFCLTLGIFYGELNNAKQSKIT